MKHAHRDDAEQRTPVEIIIAADRVTVKVMDYGSGFDLDAIPEITTEDWLRQDLAQTDDKLTA
jgi:anti-sigma regulatory factor (Ser/Thr protein kinase)